MKTTITTEDNDTARMILQSRDAHIAIIRIETMLRKYRKSDTMEYMDVIAEFAEIVDELWLPE